MATKKDLAAVALVKGTSTEMTLIAEVNGAIVRVKTEDIVPYNEDDVSYGVEWDTAVSAPECTRIGNMSLHKTLPVQALMRGCLLSDDGEVKKWLSETDWTAEDRSGKSGQVMVRIPKHWEKWEKERTKRRVRLSLYPLPGYVMIPEMYVSAYEAVLDRTNNALCSIVNTAAQYRGGLNTADWDKEERSLLGMPATGISLTSFRSYARKRKPSTTEWNCMTYMAQQTLYWLFVVEYATLNSQAAYNAALTKEGYRQGGLGDGVTTMNSEKWKAWNSSNPFVKCGYTDELGNRTGVKELTLPSGYDAATKKVSVARYRGIENPFGHTNTWTDGVNIEMNPETGNKLSKLFVCDSPAKFSSTGYDGYTYMGNLPRTSGYIKEVLLDGGCILPTAVGGGSTSYHCDYFSTDIPAAVTLRGVLFGGSAPSGAAAGLVCSNTNYAPSYTGASLGSRLCFIPNTAA